MSSEEPLAQRTTSVYNFKLQGFDPSQARINRSSASLLWMALEMPEDVLCACQEPSHGKVWLKCESQRGHRAANLPQKAGHPEERNRREGW